MLGRRHKSEGEDTLLLERQDFIIRTRYTAKVGGTVSEGDHV